MSVVGGEFGAVVGTGDRDRDALVAGFWLSLIDRERTRPTWLGSSACV